MSRADLERVARAIRSKVKVDATGLSPSVASAFVIGIEDAARAAIEAIRVPSEAMVIVAREQVWDFNPDYAPIDPDPKCQHSDSAESIGKRTWTAMIDEILKEEG